MDTIGLDINIILYVVDISSMGSMLGRTGRAVLSLDPTRRLNPLPPILSITSRNN